MVKNLTNKNLLRSKMALNDDRAEDLAKCLNVTNTTMSYKINGLREFTQNEIKKIILRYGLSSDDVIAIFFAS